MGVSSRILFIGLLLVIIGCQDILEVPDISNETVQLLAPGDSTIVLQSNVNFSWNEVYEASQYHIQVAAPNFENAAQIVVDSVIVVDSTFVSARISKSLVDSDYEWRIKAMNSDYETDFSSGRFSVDTSGN